MLKTQSKNLLLFAYFYPPLGGPAVQRPCKTVKYLTRLGWQVDVITPDEIIYHSRDESLLTECLHNKVIRTNSLDPMFLLGRLKKLLRLNTDMLYFGTKSTHKDLFKKLFPIDDKIGWYPFAIKAGRQALLTNRYQAVMVTCGPFSAALAARKIARTAGIPLIIDYRDLWTLNNNAVQPKGIIFRFLQRLEQQILQTADLVLTATDFMIPRLVNQFGADLEKKMLPYFNGWDEADFEHKHRQRQSDGKLRISYLGTLYGDRPLSPFLKALEQNAVANPDLDFELQMVGNFYPETHLEVENSGIRDKVLFIAQQNHSKAIQMMLDSDILLLVIGGEKNKWVLTGKLFEYLRSQRPILALTSPDSEAAQILKSCGHTAVCNIEDVGAIKACLSKIITQTETENSELLIPSRYERSVQVKNLNDAILQILRLSD